MTAGFTNFPDTRVVFSSTGVQRTIGTLINSRLWSGGDSFNSQPYTGNRIKELRRARLAANLSNATSRKERIAILQDYKDDSAFLIRSPRSKNAPRIPYGQSTLGGPGTLKVSVRNGFVPNSRPPKRKRRGGSENPYTCSRQLQTDSLMTWWQSGVGAVTDSTAVVHSGTSYAGLGRNPVPLLNANDDIRLVNKLKDKLNGSDFNMSVFLGEGHQTLKMVGDAAIKIARAGWHLRKGDFISAAKSLAQDATRAPRIPRVSKRATLANRWLELQYGWLPLLNDVEDGAKALAHHLNVPMRSTYRVKVERTIEGWVQPQLPLDVGVFDHHFHKKVLVAKVSEYDNSVPALLGLKDPELVAWELLPFSFVADWFLPIGQYLEARALASKLVGTFITSDLRVYNLEKIQSTMFGSGFCRLTKTEFARTVSTTLDVRMPQFKSLAQAASWQHCANAIALVTQVFTGQKVRKF